MKLIVLWAAQEPVTNSNKRPHSAIETDSGHENEEEEITITDRCDVIRRKMGAFLNTGEM